MLSASTFVCLSISKKVSAVRVHDVSPMPCLMTISDYCVLGHLCTISAVRVHGVFPVLCLMTISDSVSVLFVFLVAFARFRRFVSMVSFRCSVS